MKQFWAGVSTKKNLILTSVVGLVILAGIVTMPTVYAFNKFLPGGLDVEAGGNDQAIELHLKNLNAAQVKQNNIRAYYPGWDRYSNGKSIKIFDGPQGQICNIQNEVNGTISIDIKNSVSTQPYSVPVGQACGSSSPFFGDTFVFPNGDMTYDPTINMHYVDITVKYNTNFNINFTKSDLNYKMQLTGVSEDVGKLALIRNSAADQFGLRSSYTNDPSKATGGNKDNLRIAIPFGYHCSVPINNDAENRTVRLYDADTVFGDTYMWVTRNGAKLPEAAYVNKEKIDFWDAGGNRWKLGGSNDSANVLAIRQSDIIRGAKYELHVVNAGTNSYGNAGAGYNTKSVHFNTLSVGIPQDSIYGEGSNCDYSLRPTVSINQSSYVYYPNVQVDTSITKTGTGPVPEGHPWQLFAVRFPSQPSTTDLTNDPTADSVSPCSSTVLPSGATGCLKIADMNYPGQTNYTYPSYASGGPDTVGTRLCFFARIQNPTHLTTDDTDWHYSDLSCSVSVKKPRVQFLGSDVRIAGSARSSYYEVQNTNYGSWAEYGMFTTGSNSMVASGNGLRNGNADDTVANWNRLTFANTPSYGGYSPLPASSSAYTYFRNLPASGGNFSPGNPTTGVYDLGSNPTIGNLKVDANGQSIVLRASGTIKIANQIAVKNEGVTSAANLSQVVLVADNIEFENSADRADAWLITSPGGYINTCATGVTQLTSGPCSGLLTINGPVYTNRLMLRRTGGANPSSAAALAEPAERFNLRPDAQLWAYTYANKADYAQTDFVQELPPRY